MAAFDELDQGLQKALQFRVDFRKERYLAMNNQRWKPMSGEILLSTDWGVVHRHLLIPEPGSGR